MHTLRTPRRTLTALTVSLSALIATAASIGCSSNGSSFGEAGGSGTTNQPGVAGNSSNTTAGVGQTSGGGGQTDPTAGSGPNPGGGETTTTAGTGAGGNVGTGGNTGTAGNTGTTAGAGGGGSGGAPPVPCPKPAGQLCHEFIANDNGKNTVNYVNEFTGAKWSTSVNSTGANSPRTIEIVDNPKAAGGKAVLVSINTGYVEIDLSNGMKFPTVTAQNTTNVTGACRLADGTTALGVDTKIVIINASGIPNANGFNLPTGPNLRAINRDAATGHYWLSKTETVYDLNAQGQLQWSASMGANTKGYAVWWRAGGGVYATTGEPATIVEIDANKQIISTVGGRDNPAFSQYKLDFFSGFVRRPNGHYIVANWLGHLGTGAGKDTPMVIEFEPDGASGKVVWTWGSINAGQQTITNVYVFQ